MSTKRYFNSLENWRTLVYHLERSRVISILFKNWYSVLLQLRRDKKEIHVILRNGTGGVCNKHCIIALVSLQQIFHYNIKSKIENNQIYFKDGKLFINNIEVKDNLPYPEYLFLLSGDWIRKDNIWYNVKSNVKTLYASIGFFETFVSEQYKVDVSGKEVVDVGANIGDTPIYFAFKGAKKVYGFEPLPSIYKIAVENVRLNNLEDKVVLFNAGVGSKDGSMKVPSEVSVEESGGFSSSNSGDVEVPVYSLEKIVKEVVKDPYLLKMDCEGCEADIIMNSKDDVLSKFEIIVFEHHYENTKVRPEIFAKRFEKLGFRCNLQSTNPRKSKNILGIMHCNKI